MSRWRFALPRRPGILGNHSWRCHRPFTAQSERDKGSTFTIELPAKVDPLEAAKSPAEVEIESRQGITDGTHPVLVIDDNAEARDLLKKTLEADGFAVVTAAGGKEGLELARRFTPSLVTLDVLMPNMDGWAVLQELKGDSALKDIPVTIVSVVAERGMGQVLGAVEYLQKPVDRKLLLSMAHKYADRRNGGHALVVEDDEHTRSLMRNVLGESGWGVTEAENGAVALERVSEGKPDVILLDLMMPVMDGFDFVVKLHERDDCRSIPIIVVTAKDLTEEERRTLNCAVERVVLKGAYTQDELLQQIRDLAARCCGRKET